MNLGRDTEAAGDSHQPAQRWVRLAPLSGVPFLALLWASTGHGSRDPRGLCLRRQGALDLQGS
jgi:hypothetical protein